MMLFVWLLTVLILSVGWPARAQFNLNSTPSRVVGHARLSPIVGSPNLVEGREFSSPQSIAIDRSASPPLLYVADTGNHRVLGWRNASSFANGSPADLVIGQRNFYSTGEGGPGTAFTSGLRRPGGLAVDANGNLYVGDTGNNRILRFPRPFIQTEQLPNLVIGQTNLSTNASNAGGLSARSLATNVSASGFPLVFGGSLAFDSAGNLWALDSGNHRVLRYPVSALGDDVPNGPDADLVLGQVNFTSQVSAGTTAADRAKRGNLNVPAGLAFDPQGRLFVSDGLSRVLVFLPPFTTGKDAARLMGIQATNPCTGVPSAGDTSVGAAEAVLMIEGRPAVVDGLNHRILMYDAFEQWPSEPSPTPVVSPRARTTGPIGQLDYCSEKPNRGQPESSANTLRSPSQAVTFGDELFVTDSGNHRVLVFPLQGLGPGARASRFLGQDALDLNSPNLIEGRELSLISSSAQLPTTGVVVDVRSDPPRLYIADTLNNRVLGYRDVRKVRPGDKADLVIGQPDFQRAVPNYPSNDTDRPTNRNLRLPSGLALDPDGNLYVADTGNGRVLRFPKPFEQPELNYPVANLVIGQAGFNSKITDPTARTMGAPVGLAFAESSGLLVSDVVHHRVLFFRGSPANLTNGQLAEKVFGQPDFTTISSSNVDNKMSAPRHISTDSFLRLYVADTGNSRILIFNSVLAAEPNPRATVILRQLNSGGAVANQPRAVWVSKANDEIWVGDDSNRVYRFPHFDGLAATQNFTNFSISLPQGILITAVTQDAFGDLLIADSTNRVAIFYPGISALNGANEFRGRFLSPGAIAVSYQQALPFSNEEAIASTVPWPRDLADTQVLVNDKAAPLYYVFPGKLAFQVPYDAPTSGTGELQVVRKSTGQILGAGPVEMNSVSPALFTLNGTGRGQIAALNQDNTVNGPTNPIARGQVLSLYGTGQGVLPGGPPEGEPATGALETPEKPRVLFAIDPPDGEVLYSGVAPGLIGVWQINVRIPMAVPPNNAARVTVQYRSIFSSDAQQGIITTIAVKQ